MFRPYVSVYTYNGIPVREKFPCKRTKEQHPRLSETRSASGTIDASPTEFGLARMTVRQHLAVLERDDLVVSREERGKTGRPQLRVLS